MTIYLDNAATSFPKPESVYRAMDDFARRSGGSAGRGGHGKALEGKRVLDETRRMLAALVGCADPRLVVLTKNATEALNLAILGSLGQGDLAVCSLSDHNSVLRPLRRLEQNKGVRVLRVPTDRDGLLDMRALSDALAERPRLVVTAHARNVTGAVQPMEEIAAMCQKQGAMLCVDAAQSAGVHEINMAWGLDFVAVTGHKSLFGPTGTGALILSERGAQIPGRLFGGTGSQSEKDEHPDFPPDRFEAGTANTFGAAGLLAGLEFIERTGIENIRRHEVDLRLALAEGLRGTPGLTLFADHFAHVTSAVSFVHERLKPQEIGVLLDQKYGILARAGLHCAPGMHRAMGTFPHGSIRFSPGFFNTQSDVDEAVRAVREIVSNT